MLTGASVISYLRLYCIGSVEGLQEGDEEGEMKGEGVDDDEHLQISLFLKCNSKFYNTCSWTLDICQPPYTRELSKSKATQ